MQGFLQSNRAIDTTILKQDIEFVTMSLKSLEGFHTRAAGHWRKAGKQPLKLQDGTWTYPNSEVVLDRVGLRTNAHYIGMRRQHIASYIVKKAIFQNCVDGGVMRHGSSVRQLWWMQSMDFEMARAAHLAGPKH